MSESPDLATRPTWTCPFCPLLCEGPVPRHDGAGWSLAGFDCPHAAPRLAGFGGEPSTASPRIDGADSALDVAIAAAAKLLKGSRQPLFAGLASDVAGARSLYRLACRTGAITDGGGAAQHLVRARQDRGGWFTTLAEIRTRADVIVCLGGVAAAQGTSLFDRFGVGESVVATRHVVVIGATAGDGAVLDALASREGVTVERVEAGGDGFDGVASLAMLVGRPASPPLQALAARLRAARYAVVVGDITLLPDQGTLIVEAVHQVVATLNRSTRAGAFWIGGGDGGGTVGEVFTWLSGLPLRSRAGPRGLEHEPVCFDADRLLADGAVDAGVWISAFDAARRPPASNLPWIVLGPPSATPSDAAVYIPVATPGIGATGHLFRSDGGVVLPLTPLYADALPTVAQVIDRINLAMEHA